MSMLPASEPDKSGLNRRVFLQRAAALGIAIPSLSAFLAACSDTSSGGSSAQSGGSAADVKVVKGGTLTYLASVAETDFVWTEVSSWDNALVIVNLLDNLVYWHPIDNQLRPWLAKSWDANSDSTVFTLHLRDDVTFNDGTPLTAQVVADNLNLQGLGDPKRGYTRSTAFPEAYEIAKAVDDHTVQVSFQEPSIGFLRGLAYHTSGIVGAATLAGTKEEAQNVTSLVGTGPFVAKIANVGSEFVLTRRGGYNWAPSGLGHQGEAYLDSVTIRIVTQETVRVGSLQSGSAQAFRDVTPAEEPVLENDGYTIFGSVPPGEPLAFTVDDNVEPTNDIRVRQALQHAIDRVQLVDTLYYTKRWVPATSALQPTTPGYVNESALLTYDPDKANQLLDEAGWNQRDSAGYRTKDGTRLSFTLYPQVNYVNSQQEEEIIAQQWQKVGVEVQVRLVDPSGYAAATANIPLQITQLTVADPSGRWRSKWDSTLAAAQASTTSGNPDEHDTQIDKDFAEIAAATTEAARAQPIADIQKRLLEEAYLLPLEVNQQIFVLSPKLHGFQTTAFARPLFYDSWLES
jgi:peptide/nickel transport system substrate-binding protein